MIETVLNLILGPLGQVFGGVVAVLLILWTAYRKGRSDESQKHEKEALEAYKETTERMNDAQGDIPTLPDDAREWLRERGKKR
jgi:hypothetical protein